MHKTIHCVNGREELFETMPSFKNKSTRHYNVNTNTFVQVYRHKK